MKRVLVAGLITLALLTGCESSTRTSFYNDPDILYKKATTLNDADAQFALGCKYFWADDPNYKQDYVEARKWYEEAAKQGNVPALNNLGIIYAQGKGVKPDYKKAIKYFEQAAQSNFPNSQRYLGYIYWQGLGGIPKDIDKAKMWFEKGANQGDGKSIAGLATIYILNDKNYPAGLKLLKDALKDNNPEVQTLMGALYYNGTAVPKNINEARKYFDLACKNGFQKGCELLKDIK